MSVVFVCTIAAKWHFVESFFQVQCAETAVCLTIPYFLHRGFIYMADFEQKALIVATSVHGAIPCNLSGSPEMITWPGSGFGAVNEFAANFFRLQGPEVVSVNL